MDKVEALLAAFKEAELVEPVYDGDPATREDALVFIDALAERGFRIVSVEATSE